MTVPPYDAVTQAAGWFERPDHGLLAVTGRDRASYLQGLLSNDILALEPGLGCYAAFLTPQGRMVTDMSVLVRDHQVLVDLPARAVEPVRASWRKAIFAEEVEVARVDSWCSLGLHGPTSGAVLASLLKDVDEAALNGLVEYQHLPAAIAGTSVVVSGSRDAGCSGFILYGPLDSIGRVRRTLAARGVPAGDSNLMNLLRIEAGRPAFGIDMNEETIPLEAGIENRAISLTKGCYVGQEVIIRVLHRGQGRVAKRLVGLSVEASATDAPSAGNTLTVDGSQVGSLTSVAVSPRHGVIALGYVQRDYVGVGTELSVMANGDALQGRVVSLPFGT